MQRAQVENTASPTKNVNGRHNYAEQKLKIPYWNKYLPSQAQ